MTRGARTTQRGFTLIEIMVVVVIIGLLAAVVTYNLMGNVDEAQASKVRQDLRRIEGALKLYRLDNAVYPTTDQGLKALMEKPDDPSLVRWKPQIKRLGNDPWGVPYQYESPGTRGGAFDLYSFGSDKQPGGEGTAADIGNWNLED